MNDEKIPNNCVFCGGKARIIHFDDNMWYVQCANPSCKKHDKFAYLGSSRNNAIEQWDFMNREGSFRKSSKVKQ